MHSSILEKENSTGSLDLAEIIPNIKRFFTPNPVLYYIDLTLSVVLGNAALFLAAGATNWSMEQAAFLIVASLALFRASTFMHEAYHLRHSMKHFVLYYNLLHGFLHKVPAYIYNSHRDHHSARTYGTLKDPEYDNLFDRSFFYNFVFSPFVLMLLSPVFILIRWGILPLVMPVMGEKARMWIFQNISTLKMNLRYVMSLPSEDEKREWYAQDAGCALYTIATLAAMAAGIIPWNIFILWAVTIYILCVTNFFRAMINHRYATNFEGTTHKQQIIDSITLPLSVWNAVFYPVGLGYHSLHHMFPQIPYHNLGKTHRHLLETLPQNHPYRITVLNSYWKGVGQLISKQF